MRIREISPEDLAVLISEVAEIKKLDEAVVEKDLWVCLTLDYLFNRSPFKDSLVFKGGTSLSKCYGLIERFSEDIDLVLDWRTLGYGKDEPLETRSKTKQATFNEEMDVKNENYIKQTIVPELQKGLEIEWGSKDFSIKANEQLIEIFYPRLFEHDPYLLSHILLEIGPKALWSPSEPAVLRSMVDEAHSGLIVEARTTALTVRPERTFWEKATILHVEAHRDKTKTMPPRYSRHYYDVWCMSESWVKDAALRQPALLSEVVEFKKRFYPSNRARYEDAVPDKIRLIPEAYRILELAQDYNKMGEFIFGDQPDFNDIIDGLRNLELNIRKM